MTFINGFDIDGFMSPSDAFNALHETLDSAWGGWYEYDKSREGFNTLAGYGVPHCVDGDTFDYTPIVEAVDGDLDTEGEFLMPIARM